ncbi:hypothetical protein J7K27_03000, partial [Candidatus Bathyarchaeota archaeon]|nr:hypothetical protein [Candidatus Bathyarchaeota archaeon]
LGKRFPSKFPRSMRDFKHILSLIKVYALFHLAQRPILIRKVEEKEETYVLAVRADYEFAMRLWEKIRETTETFAPGHIIKFYYEVVKEVANEKSEFLIEDLVEKWNSKFEDKRSSDIIRKWVDFLCKIGYMNKKPDPNDKRRNVLTIIKANEKNGNYTQIKFSEFFTLEAFKEWLNEAKKISEENQVLLKKNLLSDEEASPEDIWQIYYCKNGDFSDILLGEKQGAITQSIPENSEFQKSVQFPNFQFKDIEATLTEENFSLVLGKLREACRTKLYATTEELAYMTSLAKESVLQILKRLEEEGKVVEHFEGCWRPVT